MGQLMRWFVLESARMLRWAATAVLMLFARCGFRLTSNGRLRTGTDKGNPTV